MRISTNWLSEYIDLKDVDLTLLADRITNAGVNVEGIEKGIDASHLVVGEVIECINHPDSDHLHVCKVNVGNELLQIVCGASNVRTGLKVIVSLIGAVLPGNFEIKKSTIRGVESFGMLCALNELGIEDETEGIYELPNDAVVGKNPIDYLNITNDTIYTLDLNPNRNDCLSHLGFAYEAAASLGITVKKPDISYNTSNEDIKNYKLHVDTENVNLMTLKLVKNVTIKESPKFIKDRLIAAGMRPINNVVDISNYIMLEYGQPLHFYDADKLGKNIEIRMASEGEKIITLDNKERILTNEDIVISSDGLAVSIAGVMGGASSEVDEKTKNILIESAIFNPFLIRKTSIRLDLRSEASKRFEKELNYEYTYESSLRACHLLQKYAFGEVSSGECVFDNVDKTPKKASVTLEKINSYLGLDLTEEDVRECFDRLGFSYSGLFDVTIPNRRMDVSIMEDLIEEVGRMYGFHHIKGSANLSLLKKGGYSKKIKFRKDISRHLRNKGLNEVKTYSLVNLENAEKFNYNNESLIKLKKPISSDRTHVRSSLISSLLEVYNYNISRNKDDINIYEISNTYHLNENIYVEEMKLSFLLSGSLIKNSWNNTGIKSDFYVVKGLVEDLIHYLSFEERSKYERNNYSFMHRGMSANILIDNEIVGFFGKLHPNVSKKEIYVCEISLEKIFNKKSSKLKFIEPSIYPSVFRDVAFIIDKSINSIDIVKDILKISKLITECSVFDEYIIDDKKSLAFKMKFENTFHTMEESEINDLFSKIILKIKQKYNAILRDK